VFFAVLGVKVFIARDKANIFQYPVGTSLYRTIQCIVTFNTNTTCELVTRQPLVIPKLHRSQTMRWKTMQTKERHPARRGIS